VIAPPDGFPEPLLDTGGRVVFFPVRHHSPAAARHVRALIERRRPAAVLVEGPAEFNSFMEELALDHGLPIAIFSSATLVEGERLRSFYPFCVYSPEWQAITTAREMGAVARFIDLSSPEIMVADNAAPPENAYGDGELATAAYQRALCRELGTPDIHATWDLAVEIDADMSIDEYMRRVHYYCFALRSSTEAEASNLQREAAMARHILDAMEEFPGAPLIVVTGGFHSVGLYRLVVESPTTVPPLAPLTPTIARFISLTPYSYARLDGLKGYNSGMPSPGFYDHVWHHPDVTVEELMREVVTGLRERKVRVSTADLMAAAAMTEGLARLRGHSRAWRRDLLDGLRAALLKDSVQGDSHPFIAEVLRLFRGDRLGRLADGVHLPALVREIHRVTHEMGLVSREEDKSLTLDLMKPQDRERSVVLHQLTILGVTGVARIGGTDFVARKDLTELREAWRTHWSPEFDGTCVEASAYGATLPEACRARLAEDALKLSPSPAEAAVLLVRASLAGLTDFGVILSAEVRSRIVGAQNFTEITAALGHLLYLHRYDEVLGSSGGADAGAMLGEAWNRALWLAESLGADAEDRATLAGFAAIQEVLRQAGGAFGIERDAAADTLTRIAGDAGKSAGVRGASTGILWGLDATPDEDIIKFARFFGSPDTMGRWLDGLFATARETALRLPEMLRVLDDTVVDWEDQEFLVAVPSLRLAFTPFTPREKIELAERLLEASGGEATGLSLMLELPAEELAEARAHEANVLRQMARYGVRGGVA
jgi:hypothetical protein